MEQQFLTVYIENLAKRMGDSIKNEVLLQTQLEIANQVIQNMTAEINSLKEKIEKLELKKSKKEINISETNTF